MNCPRCSAELPDNSRFCSHCGHSVTDPGSSTARISTAVETDQLLATLRHDLAADYDVEKELGRGGMAVVYRAVEKELQRTVALKVLPPGTGGQMAERFRREARMAAQVAHPNIIPVYRVGQAAGTYYFTMKYVDGRALDAIIESQGALPIPVVLHVLRGAVAGLAHAHDHNIIHRDIKGANVLIERDGHVLLSDLGIARAGQDKTLTATGSVIGTPHFMSPEQCSGQKVGPQSDQYSMGILAFQMLTGQVPFDADSLMGILHHQFFTPPPHIAEVRDGVPEALANVIYRALEKDPAHRFETTKQMLRAIEAVPFSDADHEQAEELLRQLVQGGEVQKVRTRTLPPLTVSVAQAATVQARLSGGRVAPTASEASTRPTARIKPPAAATSRRPLVIAVVVVVAAAGVGGTLLLRDRGGEALVPPDTAAGATRMDLAERTTPGDSQPSAVVPAAAQPVAAPPPTAQPAESAAGPGTVLLRGAPRGAQVKVDGTPRTGTRLRLEPGEHRIEVTAQGYQPFTQSVTVAPGAQRTVTVTMRADAAAAEVPAAATGTATIRLSVTPPEAQITVNGQAAGQGNLFDYSVPAGARVRIVARASGFDTLDSTYTFTPGESRNLRRWTMRPSGGAP
jgi:serine/threonine protein kinase